MPDASPTTPDGFQRWWFWIAVGAYDVGLFMGALVW